MERLILDLRYAVRGMLKRPVFSLVVIITLALGIGANTAIFSVVDAVLLRPLNFRDPDQLVVLTTRNVSRNLFQQPAAYMNAIDWRSQNRVFDHLALVRGESMSLTNQPDPERVAALRASIDILSLLGVKPSLGRDFRDGDDVPGGNFVAILSDSYWRRHGSDPGVIGDKLTLDGNSYTVIGVLPPGVKQAGVQMASIPPTGVDLWLPLVPTVAEQNRNFANMRMVARLKPGVSLSQARAEMDTLASRSAAQYPENNSNVGIEVTPLAEHLTGNARRAIWILFGAVICVLLIACVNVANLLLARATSRQSEMALRSALGAGRSTLIRQMLTESVVLSLAGGLLGLLAAYQGVTILSGINARNIPRVEEIRISGKVLLFTFSLALTTGILFGLIPALRSSSIHLTEFLKAGKKGGATGGANRRLLQCLVVGEIAIALVLLTGAGLLLRSFREVNRIDPGFELERVLSFAVPLPAATYKDHASQLAFHERAIERLKATPGVDGAATTFRVPLVGAATAIFTVEGKPVRQGSEPSADYRSISPDYMKVMGMRVNAGRYFTPGDTAESPFVVVINEQLAQRFFPGENALGKRLQIAAETTRWREVVGIVRDAKLSGLEAPTDPAIYVPLPQNTWANALRLSSIAVRTGVEPHLLIPSIQKALHEVDPALPITQLRTMEEIVSESLSPRRFNTILLTVFALVAAILAAVGIYGVMSYNVTQRTHEMGIRMAIGAAGSDIVRMVTREGAVLALSGISIGAVLSLISARLVSGLLFGVSQNDPMTLLVIATLLGGVTLLASYLPARRAGRTDPLEALKE